MRPWTTRPLSQTVVQAALPVAIPTSSRGALPYGQLDFSLMTARSHMLIHTFTGTTGCPPSLRLCLLLLALGSRMAPEAPGPRDDGYEQGWLTGGGKSLFFPLKTQ